MKPFSIPITKRARKEHNCVHCNQAILIKSEYVIYQGSYNSEGWFVQDKYHTKCWANALDTGKVDYTQEDEFI